MADVIDTWGQVGYLTESEQEALDSFLKFVPSIELLQAKYSVESIEQASCRFLRARNFDVDKAIVLLKERSQLMKEFNAHKWAQSTPEECASCDIQAMKTYFPHGQYGRDRLGRVLMFEHNGRSNIPAVLQMTCSDWLLQYHFWTMQKVLDDQFSLSPLSCGGRSVISTCAICDFEGIGIQHFNLFLPHLKRLVKIDNICYPEMLGKLVVINAPSLALGIWGLVKGWLDTRTQNKIEILGSGPDTTARLHQLISAEFLPPCYGGTGPDIYLGKENTEFITIGGNGVLRREMSVPAGHRMTIDAYVNDGTIDIEVSHYVESMTEHVNMSVPHVETESASLQVSSFVDFEGKNENMHLIGSAEAETTTLFTLDASFVTTVDLIKTLETSGKEGIPARHLMSLPYSPTENRRFFIVMKNNSFWFQRNIVFSLSVEKESL